MEHLHGLIKQTINYEFQAEGSHLLQIILNSGYKTYSIILHELILNGIDVVDKIRYQSLADKSVVKDKCELDIEIQIDRDAVTLTTVDSAIGITKVGNQVIVVSKSQCIWWFGAGGSFTVARDTRENGEIQNTTKRYPEFMQYPIYYNEEKKNQFGMLH